MNGRPLRNGGHIMTRASNANGRFIVKCGTVKQIMSNHTHTSQHRATALYRTTPQEQTQPDLTTPQQRSSSRASGHSG
ncbi:Hypothetical predicted protein [Drosophila guanche]|uniref:Uncharacterized protein n=1 Tax=Drosophila guanche TaxID=7266 RepID=A0A3B0KGW4_DROGU|nr:Hypothetical predicted protein [Drosophila guanche]